MNWWKVIALAAFLLFAAGTAWAEKANVSVDFGAGYRSDKLDWSITGAGVNPLSELEWKNLDIVFAKSNVRMSYKRFHAKGSIDYGKIVDGENRDSDWALSGRQAEFSRSHADTGGSVFDASIGVGYEFPIGKVTIIPLVGYSWHLQMLEDRDLDQVLCDTSVIPGCTLGPIAGLDSSYDARWQGPWFGVDVNVQPSDKLHIYTSAEYHYGDYVGQGYWNLRSLEFEQLADAEGYVLSGGFSYAIKDSTDIGLEFQYTDWESKAGVDAFLNAIGSTVFNSAKWKSASVMFNATYRFYQINNNKMLSKM